MTVVAGIGCRRNCPASAIVAAIREAEAAAGRRATHLAAPAFKSNEPGLHQAATLLNLPLTFVDTKALEAVQPSCPTRSPTALAATGLASIAEAAALAASGGTLIQPRTGQGLATCALAAALFA